MANTVTCLHRNGLLHGLALVLACVGSASHATPPLQYAAADPVSREEQRAAREAQRAAQAAQREARRAEQAARRDASQTSRADQQALCDRIVAWLADTGERDIPAAVLALRFGGGSRSSTTPATQIPYESWLFQDGRFAAAFGERFDAVDAQTRRRFQSAGNGCAAPRNARNQAIADNMLFFRAFDDRYYVRYGQGVAAIREAHVRRKAMATALAGLPANDEGLRSYRQYAEQAAALEPFLTLERRQAQQQAFRASYQRVVQPMHYQAQHDALRSAQGAAGLTALVMLQREQARDARIAGTTPALAPDVQARQQSLARDAVAGARREIDALDDGLTGLMQEADWYRQHQAGLGALAGDVPELAEISRHFLATRGKTLDGAQAALGARIAATDSPESLNALLAQYLALPEDRTRPSGLALLAQADIQRQTLHKRTILGGATPAAPLPGQPVLPTTAPAGEPTESEMYDALAHALDSHNTAAREVAAQCNNRAFVTNNDPAQALQCLQYGLAVGVTNRAQDVVAPVVAISRFEKIGCEKAQGEPGYRCDYVAGMSSNVALPASVQALYREGAITQARFVRQPSGWLLIANR